MIGGSMTTINGPRYRALLSSATALTSVFAAGAAQAAAAPVAETATPVTTITQQQVAQATPVRSDEDRYHRHSAYRPHGHQLGLADRCHQLAGDHFSRRRTCSIRLRTSSRRSTSGRTHLGCLDLRSRALAARAAGRRNAGSDQRQAVQPLGAGPGLYRRRYRPVVWIARAPISPQSRRSRSRTCRSFGTEPPRNMVRTRSPGS